MWNAKDEITEAVKRVIDVLMPIERGTIVPWRIIEQTSGFERRCSQWTSFSCRLKRDFRNLSGCVLWPVQKDRLGNSDQGGSTSQTFI